MRGAKTDAVFASNSDTEFGERTMGPLSEFASNSAPFSASENGGWA
jgi:hypothetical protein